MEIFAGRFKTGNYVNGGFRNGTELTGSKIPEVQVGFRDNKALDEGIGSQIKFGSMTGSLPGLATEIVQFTIDSTGKGIIRLDGGVADAGLPLNYILDGDIYMQVGDDTAGSGNYTIGAGPYGQANNYGVLGVFHRQHEDRNSINVEPVDAITAVSGTVTPALGSEYAAYTIGAGTGYGTIATLTAGGQTVTGFSMERGQTSEIITVTVADESLVTNEVINITYSLPDGGNKVTVPLYRKAGVGYEGESDLLAFTLYDSYIGTGTEAAPVPAALAIDIHDLPDTPVYTPAP